MDNQNENIMINRFAFERMQAKDERNDKWRNITIILLICLLVASNGMWLWAWMQYDYSSEEITVEGQENANYIGEDGSIYNGSQEEEPEQWSEEE